MTTPAPSLVTTCGYGAACLRAVNGVASEVGAVERVEALTGTTRQWWHPECRVTADNAPRTASVTVGLTPTLIADARPRRESITIQNPGSSAVTIGYGQRQATDLSLTSGLRIPAGGSITEEVYTGPIYGMGTVSLTVNIIEIGS